MASINPPLTDPEPDKTLPSLPASLLASRANETMAPVTSHQPSPSVAECSFADPSEEAPLSPSNPATPTPAHMALSDSADAGNALRANIAQNGTAARDFTHAMTRDSPNVGLKTSSFNSTVSTAPPSYRTDTTPLSSSTIGIAITADNPFADPAQHDRVQEQVHTRAGAGHGPPTPSTPFYTQNQTIGQNRNTNYLHPNPSPNSSMAPTPPPKSPNRALGSNRWTTVSSIANHIQGRLPPGLHSQGHTSTNSLASEALARDSARRQDILLATERAKHSASQCHLQEPHLRPSPSAVRVAAELIRARDASVTYGGQAVLTSPAFWIAVLCMQCGLVSMAAAIAVIIEASQYGNKVYVGAGRAFWLVISIVVFVLSAGVAGGIWLRKKGAGFGGGEEGILRRLGCDEVRLLDRNIARDMEMGEMDPGAERGSMASPRPSLRGRQRGYGSSASVRTRDPEWQALYTTPKELRQMVSTEALGDAPVRRGARGLHQEGDRTRVYQEQRSAPPRKCATNPKPAQLTRSDKSWPLRSSPHAAPFVNVHPEYPSPASDHAHPQEQYPSHTPPGNYPPPANPDESRVEVLSPLSSLTQSIQNASESSLPVHHRSQFIHGHRVASEERVRTLRQSLETCSRGNSATETSSRDLSRISSSTSSDTSERTEERIVKLELGSSEERIGRRRSQSVDVGSLMPGSKRHSQKAREVLATVKGHFQHTRGRSLGGVVREKMARLKEASVESNTDSQPPLPLTYPTSPLRDQDIFIIGDDDSPTTTPSKPPRSLPLGTSSSARASAAKTPSKIPRLANPLRSSPLPESSAQRLGE